MCKYKCKCLCLAHVLDVLDVLDDGAGSTRRDAVDADSVSLGAIRV